MGLGLVLGLGLARVPYAFTCTKRLALSIFLPDEGQG